MEKWRSITTPRFITGSLYELDYWLARVASLAIPRERSSRVKAPCALKAVPLVLIRPF